MTSPGASSRRPFTISTSRGRLTGPLNIVGISRTPFSHPEWRERLSAGVLEHSPLSWDRARWEEFARHVWYVPGNAGLREDMTRLNNFLLEREQGPGKRLYYLSVAPPLYVPIVHNLGSLGMHRSGQGWRRAIFEKPFGTDLASARALNREIHRYFEEGQVFRIDHYLGKETIQNIIYLRFANAIFEPLWNRSHIDNVQISALEAVDVGTRGGYYDDFGVFRDMFQNHMLQMMMLTAIEPPDHFDADLIRDEKVRLLNSVRPIRPEDVVCGQYGGYNPADETDSTVRTATYAALRLWVDNERWGGVPFYLRTGKALARKRTGHRHQLSSAAAAHAGRAPVHPQRALHLSAAGRGRAAGDRRQGAGHGQRKRAACTWAFATTTPSPPRPSRKPTSGCCTTPCRATPRSSPAATASRPPGS